MMTMREYTFEVRIDGYVTILADSEEQASFQIESGGGVVIDGMDVERVPRSAF
jgi:hypothetical protein